MFVAMPEKPIGRRGRGLDRRVRLKIPLLVDRDTLAAPADMAAVYAIAQHPFSLLLAVDVLANAGKCITEPAIIVCGIVVGSPGHLRTTRWLWDGPARRATVGRPSYVRQGMLRPCWYVLQPAPARARSSAPTPPSRRARRGIGCRRRRRRGDGR